MKEKWRLNILIMIDRIREAGWLCSLKGFMDEYIVTCYSENDDLAFCCKADSQLKAYGHVMRALGLSSKNQFKVPKPKFTKLIEKIEITLGMYMLASPHYLYEMGFISHPNDIFRLLVFRDKGVVCAGCGITGEYFSLIQDRGGRVYLTLFAMNEHGTEVMMTCDHIIPVSKGGTNFKDNLQPMCEPCNSKKADRMV